MLPKFIVKILWLKFATDPWSKIPEKRKRTKIGEEKEEKEKVKSPERDKEGDKER